MHGFASDGRHDVQYYRFKDFHQPYDDDAKSRMAGMKGGLSTRMLIASVATQTDTDALAHAVLMAHWKDDSDLADPDAEDLVLRESTRVSAAAVSFTDAMVCCGPRMRRTLR